MITPEQARAELARRELSRREAARGEISKRGLLSNAKEVAGKATRGLFAPTQIASELGQSLAGADSGIDVDKQISENVIGFGNQATLGLPRYMTEKMTGVDVGQGALPGQMAGMVAGPGKLANLAVKPAKFLYGGSGLMRLGKAGVRGALEGGIAGALTAPSELEQTFDANRRVGQAVVGTAGGALGGVLAQGIGDKLASNALNKVIKEKESALQALEEVTKLGDEASESAKMSLLGGMAKSNKALSQQLKSARSSKQAISVLKESAEKSDEALMSQLSSMADEDAGEIASRWNDAYNSRKMKINQNMDEVLSKAGGVDFEDVEKLKSSMISELKQSGVELSEEQLKSINKIINQYDPRTKFVGYGDMPKIDASSLRNMRTAINSEIRKTAFQRGGVAADDLADVVFSKKLGDLIESKAPGFRELNSELSDLYKFKKFANSRFNDSVKGSEYLQRLVGKSQKSEIQNYNKFLDWLEGGGVKVGRGLSSKAEEAALARVTSKANIEKASKELSSRIKMLESQLSSGKEVLSKEAYKLNRELGVLKSSMNNLSYLDRYGRESADIVFKGGAGYMLFKLLNRIF